MCPGFKRSHPQAVEKSLTSDGICPPPLKETIRNCRWIIDNAKNMNLLVLRSFLLLIKVVWSLHHCIFYSCMFFWLSSEWDVFIPLKNVKLTTVNQLFLIPNKKNIQNALLSLYTTANNQCDFLSFLFKVNGFSLVKCSCDIQSLSAFTDEDWVVSVF